MSQITEETINKVAHLARLKITQEDLIDNVKNISLILDLVENINAADVENLAPLANPLDASLTLRQDTVIDENLRDEFMALAPQSEAGLFLVPKVIE